VASLITNLVFVLPEHDFPASAERDTDVLFCFIGDYPHDSEQQNVSNIPSNEHG
jgi:hypothetical protein